MWIDHIYTSTTSSKFNARTSINISNDRITLNSHNFETGDPLRYRNGGGTTLLGLVNEREYFAIKYDNNTISLVYQQMQ